MATSQKNLLFLLAIAIILLAIEISPSGFIDPDGYYHIQMAQFLASGRFLTAFPWLSASTWAKHFADQHLLYHILLIPFIKTSPIVGAQIFNALAGAAFCAIFYSLLRFKQISYAKLWTLFAIFASSGFLLRLSLVKATALSLCLIFLFVRFLLNNEPVKLFILSFIFVWTYGGFVFLPVILALYAVSLLISGWLREKRIFLPGLLAAAKKSAFKAVVYPLLGIILGLLLFPHALDLLHELYNQIFRAGLAYKIPVGMEWNPLGAMGLVEEYGFMLFIWLAAFGFAFKKKRLADSHTLFLFFLSIFFFGLSIKSERFVEDAAPFMVLFSAHALQPFLSRFSRQEIRTRIREKFFLYIPLLLGIFFILLVSLAKARVIVKTIHQPVPITRFRGVSQYLVSHSEAGEIIFNAGWDSFPQLLFLNSRNYYVTGMDPMFMYIAGRDKYWLWRHISDGDAAICPAPICNVKNTKLLENVIKNDFGAAYVILEKPDSARLNLNLQNNNHFILAYTDANIALYQINPSP